ncbi:DoxX family protein [Chitinophagaceae bacterium LWZ2-11]
MKKILSVNYSQTAFNIAMLCIRLSFGLLIMVNHGLVKLMHFSEMQVTFYNFMGLGPRISLGLAIFAELICSLFVVIGLFTRLSVIPLLITMMVAYFGVHFKDALNVGEMAIIYGTAFFVLLLCGPGKISVDGMIGK